MKKSIFGLLNIICLSLLIFNSSCKKSDEIPQNPKGLFAVTSGVSKVKYFHFENLTYLVMIGRIASQNEIGGRITSWQFIFKSGNTELFEINNGNYPSYALYSYGEPIMNAYNSGVVTVSYADQAHQNFSPFLGKPFSADPDNMDIFITVTDDNSNIQTVHFNTTVTYNSY